MQLPLNYIVNNSFSTRFGQCTSDIMSYTCTVYLFMYFYIDIGGIRITSGYDSNDYQLVIKI